MLQGGHVNQEQTANVSSWGKQCYMPPGKSLHSTWLTCRDGDVLFPAGCSTEDQPSEVFDERGQYCEPR